MDPPVCGHFCMSHSSFLARVRAIVVGRPRDLRDASLFHKVSLVAVLAWVGLGADGLSSSCYGPEETFKALGQHMALAPIVAGLCVLTILVICASYRQIIELFPHGGGGYLVASKLLSAKAGLVSGCALLVDYVLTIAISIAAGADALFSVLPPEYVSYKLLFASIGIGLLTLINLRGVRESVTLFAPIFFCFVVTHGLVILIVIGTHLLDFGAVFSQTSQEIQETHQTLGWWGMIALLLRAFSVGAGTYTGIEAVSNGLPVLREPKVQTGRRTMLLMGASLAITVFGLLMAYLLESVTPAAGKTLNAVLFETVTRNWPASVAPWFVWISMVSATALLFIAAQAGFLDGPRVLASMALDRWFPTHFATLSDRLVMQKGILLMGGAALLTLLLTRGSVGVLVVLYSINVFLTFTLSQLGMVSHWWRSRGSERRWRSKLAINSVGLLLTSFILVTLCIEKFHDGGWMTVLVTSLVILLALAIRGHYARSRSELTRLDALVTQIERVTETQIATPPVGANRTAIVLVNGYNGLGLHTVLGIFRMFPNTFGTLHFIQVGAIDAGTFKGAEELEHLREQTQQSVERYMRLGRRLGLKTEATVDLDVDPVAGIQRLANRVLSQHRHAVIFGGQLSFARETLLNRWLHNFVVFSLQRIFCRDGVPFVIVPVRI